jgi:hypothetical protein
MTSGPRYAVPRLRIPPATAPLGTLLRAIQEAHHHSRGTSEFRKRVLDAMRDHEAVLSRTPASPGQIAFAANPAGNPWHSLLFWVHEALSKEKAS